MSGERGTGQERERLLAPSGGGSGGGGGGARVSKAPTITSDTGVQLVGFNEFTFGLFLGFLSIVLFAMLLFAIIWSHLDHREL